MATENGKIEISWGDFIKLIWDSIRENPNFDQESRDGKNLSYLINRLALMRVGNIKITKKEKDMIVSVLRENDIADLKSFFLEIKDKSLYADLIILLKIHCQESFEEKVKEIAGLSQYFDGVRAYLFDEIIEICQFHRGNRGEEEKIDDATINLFKGQFDEYFIRSILATKIEYIDLLKIEPQPHHRRILSGVFNTPTEIVEKIGSPIIKNIFYILQLKESQCEEFNLLVSELNHGEIGPDKFSAMIEELAGRNIRIDNNAKLSLDSSSNQAKEKGKVRPVRPVRPVIRGSLGLFGKPKENTEGQVPRRESAGVLGFLGSSSRSRSISPKRSKNNRSPNLAGFGKVALPLSLSREKDPGSGSEKQGVVIRRSSSMTLRS